MVILIIAALKDKSGKLPYIVANDMLQFSLAGTGSSPAQPCPASVSTAMPCHALARLDRACGSSSGFSINLVRLGEGSRMEMEDGQKVCLAGWQLRLGSILFRALEPSNQNQASAKSTNQPR